MIRRNFISTIISSVAAVPFLGSYKKTEKMSKEMKLIKRLESVNEGESTIRLIHIYRHKVDCSYYFFVSMRYDNKNQSSLKLYSNLKMEDLMKEVKKYYPLISIESYESDSRKLNLNEIELDAATYDYRFIVENEKLLMKRYGKDGVIPTNEVVFDGVKTTLIPIS